MIQLHLIEMFHLSLFPPQGENLIDDLGLFFDYVVKVVTLVQIEYISFSSCLLHSAAL